MDTDLQARIRRAKALLATARHAAVATVNSDGSPHNTPLWILHDYKLENLYWGSHPDSIHSQNILRTGQIFVVYFDVKEKGGLYIKASNGSIISDQDLDVGVALARTARLKEGKGPVTKEYFINSSQRMWSAKINKIWINTSERDDKGLVIRDYRVEVNRIDLIS